VILLKSSRELEHMRAAGRILAEVKERLKALVRAGVSTKDIDEDVEAFIGDIIGLDLGCIVEGYYGDCAVTLPVGSVPARVQELLDVTRESLDKAIVQCRPGNRIGDISCAVQEHCEGHGFGVVRAFVGHGIGRSLHEDPQVPNFGEAGRGPALKAGMVLAIEPMVTMGSYEVQVLEDGWTAVTVDGSLAAHFEDTIAITENGPDVLTRVTL
jgi:methionyl aminopeptidase